ncbi:MAG: type II toxin-antitoxin system death-on-curing family toxin [Chloroflexota bacterium]|nr:type II toxin-antitoxin system death-on-curing family toxin [Chloroflexota bacterium]
MSAELLFLTVPEVLALHKDQLRLFGGADGLRDAALLESAVAAPMSTFDGVYLHEGIFQMAAAYAFHLAENQPFLDGNKRTALNAALVFLDINGWVVLDPEMRLYDAMIALSTHELDKQGLATLLRELATPLDEKQAAEDVNSKR